MGRLSKPPEVRRPGGARLGFRRPPRRHDLRSRTGRDLPLRIGRGQGSARVRARRADRHLGLRLLPPRRRAQGRRRPPQRAQRAPFTVTYRLRHRSDRYVCSGRKIAYEALSRFPGDPSHTPDRWFDDAWRIGLGIPLELLAARVAAGALSRLPDDVGLSINASPPVVSAQGFLQCLGAGVDRVAVEVTEHLRVDDYEEIRLKLSPLREAGGQIAIDDFGAGYASLHTSSR